MSKQYASLKEKIAAEKVERAARYEAYQELYNKAQAIGYAAGDTMTPRVMTVTDGNGVVIERVSEGMCGFASVIVHGANKGFGHWLLKQGFARKAYHGGAEIWIGAHNQSYERKMTHAQAMAHAINEAGINCYACGRLD
jgi:hypothetical protein